MQQGSTFGEKLANAIDSVFQKGFQKIIVIGNDCLTLTSHQINKAASGLIDNDAVIAPTCKGGVYLLGITKSLFDKQGFINVRWQTSSTCQDLLTLMAGQQVFRLPIQDDVNSYVDLRKQLTLLIKNSALRIFLDGLISLTHIRYFRISDLIVSPQPQYSFGLKAPPASLS